jgi:hypothetical protein
MEQTERPVGWHADLEANRYRYWDGARWAFSSSARDLEAYRTAGQEVAGVDFAAPVHSELPPEKTSSGPRRPLLIGAGVLLLLAVVVVVLMVTG